MANYIVSERNYEYDDEYYHATEGGTPVYVGASLEDAKNWVNSQILFRVKHNDLFMVERRYLDGSKLEEYIENFGKDSLNIIGTSDSYADSMHTLM